MKLHHLEVAIAGAGIGGLSLATMLARDGARVTIYDQMDTPRPVGSGFVLQPTGSAVLAHMGLLDEAKMLGSRIHRMIGRLPRDGRVVLDISYNAQRYGIAIQRTALFNLLFKAAMDAGVRFEAASKVMGFDSGPRPVLVLESGRRTPEFDLVVDTMGAGSPVGREVGSKELTYGALWATVPWPAGGPFKNNLLEQRYVRASRMAGVLPVGRANPEAPLMATFFWSLRNGDHAEWASAGRNRWIDEVAAIWPEAASFAEQAEPVHARYRHHTRTLLIGQNILRLGDAWHATSPQLGQGANMALLDAASLALALKMSASIDEAINLHRRQRTIHVHFYQALSRIMTPFYQSDSRTLPVVRDFLIGPVSTAPGIGRMISAIVTGDVFNPVGRLGLTRSRAL